MTEKEQTIFQAALDIDKFAIYDGVSNHEELGKRVPENEEMSRKVALYLDERAGLFRKEG